MASTQHEPKMGVWGKPQ